MNPSVTLLWVIALAVVCGRSQAQTITPEDLQPGDLIFQDLDCGPLCDAIESVTPAYQGHHFSHVGLVAREANGGVVVWEATHPEVTRTPLSGFLDRSSAPVYVGRVRADGRQLILAVLAFVAAQDGTPYDDQFLVDNGKYYCSELIYDAFKKANGDHAYFQLAPMTYRAPGSTDFFPAWVAYFEERAQPVPEGEPGCNPGGLAQSEHVTMFLLKR